MNDDLTDHYQEEIRDYLLGRLAREHATGASEMMSAELPTPPILAWWIFEGKHYRGLEQCLAQEFNRVHRQARQLRATYNPHWRYVQAPEGDIDWVTTAFASATSAAPEYVCKTSKIGLSHEEGIALDGWLSWLGRRWAAYVQELSAPSGTPDSVPWQIVEESPVTFRQLQRWAAIAKRSRWPLLRNVVAETLRCVLEPSVMLSALPLPSDHATLFELVCIVRILRVLEPTPSEIRWLDLDAGQNTIVTRTVIVKFQFHLERREVLAGVPFDQASASGIQRFGVAVPRIIDALFHFKKARNGFAGILLEAKSGAQEPYAALFQLLCYSNALSRTGFGPMLVLGVTEKTAVDANEESSSIEDVAEDNHCWAFPNLTMLEPVVARWSQFGAKGDVRLMSRNSLA